METIANIAQDEGYAEFPYLCTKKKLTWLYGRNLTARPIEEYEWRSLEAKLQAAGTLEEWAYNIFEEDLLMYNKSLMLVDVYISLYSSNIQVILLNLAYNMGTTRFQPRKWPMFFAALARKDYNEMARQLKYTDPENSDDLSGYFKDVPNRAERLYKSILEEINA